MNYLICLGYYKFKFILLGASPFYYDERKAHNARPEWGRFRYADAYKFRHDVNNDSFRHRRNDPYKFRQEANDDFFGERNSDPFKHRMNSDFFRQQQNSNPYTFRQEVRDDFFRAHAYPRPNYRKPGQSSPLKIFAFLLVLQVVDQLTIIIHILNKTLNKRELQVFLRNQSSYTFTGTRD